MSVSDNGIGFCIKKAGYRSGGNGSLGLMSMQERSQLIGAELKINSAPGEGTTVSAEVKL